MINVNRVIRDRIVKLSDEAWAGVINELSLTTSGSILDSSLVKEWRRIAGHGRSAAIGLDHIWFLDESKSAWACFACASNEDNIQRIIFSYDVNCKLMLYLEVCFIPSDFDFLKHWGDIKA